MSEISETELNQSETASEAEPTNVRRTSSRRRNTPITTINPNQSKNKFLGSPTRIVVQLDRLALKFLDLKGTIAQKYYSPNFDLAWGQEVTEIPFPIFADKLVLKNSNNNSQTSISINRTLYENDNAEANLSFFANDVSRLVKDIESMLGVDQYTRWGVRIWYKLPETDAESLIADRIMKLGASVKASTSNLFRPDEITLRFRGEVGSQKLKYSVNLGRGFVVQEGGKLVTNNDMTIDVDYYRENVRGLADLQNFIQNCLNDAGPLAEKFLEEVLQWQIQQA